MRSHCFLLRATSATIISLALATGCAGEKTVPKSASSGNATTSEGRHFRQGEGDRDGTGVSSTSREVEKDLGLR